MVLGVLGGRILRVAQNTFGFVGAFGRVGEREGGADEEEEGEPAKFHRGEDKKDFIGNFRAEERGQATALESLRWSGGSEGKANPVRWAGSVEV